jgi:hypothetical protein
VTQNSVVEGEMLVISMPGKDVPKCCSGLRPQKELPEWCSGGFHHKNTPAGRSVDIELVSVFM